MEGGRSIPWEEIAMRFEHKVPTPWEEPPKSFKHKVSTYHNDNSLRGLDLESLLGDENSLKASNLEMSSDTILLSPPHFFSSTSVTSSISSWSSDNRPQYVSPTHSLTHSPSISRSHSTSPNITMIPNSKSPMDVGENNMGGNSCVPFVWEESPGKSAISTWKQLHLYDEVSTPSHSLKLPPKLLAPSKREPCGQEQRRPGGNFSSSSSSLVTIQRSCLSWKLPKNHKLLRLCKSMSLRSTYPKGPLTANTTATTTSNTWGVPTKLFQRSKNLNVRATMTTKTKKPDIADNIVVKDVGPSADADDDVRSVDNDIFERRTHAPTGRRHTFIRHGELTCIQTHHKLIKLCKSLFNSARSSHFLLHHHHSHKQEKKVHTAPKQTLHDMNSTPNKRFFFETTGPTLVGLKVMKPKSSPIALAEEKLNVERVDAWLNSINLHGREEAIFSPVSTQYSEPCCSPDVWKCSIKFDESQPSSPKRMQPNSMDGMDHVSLSGGAPHGRGGAEQEDSDDDGHDLEHRDYSSDPDHCDGHGSSHGGSQVHGHGDDDHGGSHGYIHGNSDSDSHGHGHGDSQGHNDSHGHGHSTNMSISSEFSCQSKPSFIITSSPCKSYNATHDDDDDEMSPRKKVLLSILSMVRIRNKFGKVIKLTSPKITHMAPTPTPTPTPPNTTTKRTSATSFSDIEVQSTMNSPWILDLGPHHEMKKDGCKVHYMLSSTQLVKLKNIVVRKVSFKKGRCNEVYNNGDMWSPSLATYLYNQQKEKEEKEALEENNDPGIMSVHSTSASFRLHLDRIPLSSTRNQSSPYNIDLCSIQVK